MREMTSTVFADGLLDGCATLVTGGGTGLGKEISLQLARKGCDVAVNYSRSEEEAARTVEEIEALGRRAIAVQADVSQSDQVGRMVERVVDELGGLQILINNAGTTVFVPFADLDGVDEATWDRVMAVNVKGMWLCLREEIRAMRESGGSIVNTSSVGGFRGNTGLGAYQATKHAVIGLTRTAAHDNGPLGIRVNAVAPGLIDKQIARDVVAGDERAYAEIAEHVPIGRAGRPEEIASAVLWLCSPGASYVVGHALTVDGGMTVV